LAEGGCVASLFHIDGIAVLASGSAIWSAMCLWPASVALLRSTSSVTVSRLKFSVENLFYEQYSTVANYRAPGRTFNLSVTLLF
jgi:hypothetical protein